MKGVFFFDGLLATGLGGDDNVDVWSEFSWFMLILVMAPIMEIFCAVGSSSSSGLISRYLEPFWGTFGPCRAARNASLNVTVLRRGGCWYPSTSVAAFVSTGP